MSRAAMALARALGSVAGCSAPFEALEARSLLSAPVISGSIESATVETMTIRVHFAAGSADDPIVLPANPSIGVTGPNGFAQIVAPYHAEVYYDLRRGITSDGAGGLWGSYDVASPQHFFVNGTYTVGVAAGVVHTQHGDTNVAGGAGQAYLWFPDEVFAGAAGNLFSQQFQIWVTHWDRNAPDTSDGVNVSTLEMVRPDGEVVAAHTPSTGFRTYGSGMASFDAPGGTWEFSDNGTYTVRAPVFDAGGARTGSVVVAQYYLWFGPRAELLHSSFSDYQWSVTVRYTGGSGIDLSSIGNQNAYFNFGGGTIDTSPLGSSMVSRFASLTGAPTVNQDGSVDATYVYYTGPQGFTAEHSGPAAVNIMNVRGSGGDYARGVVLDQRTISSLTPYVASVSSVGVTPNSWTISTLIGSAGIDYFPNLFSGGALRIEGPGGVVLTPQAVDVVSHGESYGLTYTLTLAAGQRFGNGEYRVFLRQGGLSIGGQGTDEVMLGSWWLWFAA